MQVDSADLKCHFGYEVVPMGARIMNFVNEGLGHPSYLVDLGDGTIATMCGRPERATTADSISR